MPSGTPASRNESAASSWEGAGGRALGGRYASRACNPPPGQGQTARVLHDETFTSHGSGNLEVVRNTAGITERRLVESRCGCNQGKM